MPRLNSFAVKLMLALALTVLIAVGAVALAINRAASRQFSDYVMGGMMHRATALVPLLAEYYVEQGGWQGAEDLLAGLGMPVATMGRGAMYGRGPVFAGGAALVLADADGRVVADDIGGDVTGRMLSADTLADSIPIVVDDRAVGYLLGGKGPREIEFEQQLDRSILLAGLAAGAAAIVLGVVLTRTLLRPLRIVEEGARRIGAGDLSHRVDVTSGDEVGDLATRFNEMADALERQEMLRRAMMADIAHELRTPLAAIRAQVEAVQDGVFDCAPENIRPIHDQVLLLGRLVNDLRELALAEAGQLPLERTEVDLRQLVGRVVAAFQPGVTEKGVNLSAMVAEGVPAIEGDPQRLEQVLGNLLGNAVRHTSRGGSVTVSVESEGPWITLSVLDTGTGIAPEDLPHVFDRFYRGGPSRAKTKGGTGLGLSIARQLVEAHGGEISVASILGRGTTFTVRLSAPGPGTASAR